MKCIFSIGLKILGGFFFHLTRLYHLSIREYKTFLIRKYNPDVYYIGCKVYFNNPRAIKIGKNSYINGGELYTRGESIIEIGDNVMISYNVTIRTDMHNHNRIDIPMIEQSVYVKNIKIEDDVWIGQGAYIMPGVTIHKGAIVGAHAVVTRDVDEYTVVGGVPAKVIGRRTEV